jgi:hypothetical protein
MQSFSTGQEQRDGQSVPGSLRQNAHPAAGNAITRGWSVRCRQVTCAPRAMSSPWKWLQVQQPPGDAAVICAGRYCMPGRPTASMRVGSRGGGSPGEPIRSERSYRRVRHQTPATAIPKPTIIPSENASLRVVGSKYL